MTELSRTWYKAKLTPVASGLFTEGFYPPANRLGNRYVYFTQVDVTPSNSKVLMASRMHEAGLRMLTKTLAQACLIPTAKATPEESAELNTLSQTLKV